ncbi:conserved hypothetical protein, partial [Ricinus communis]
RNRAAIHIDLVVRALQLFHPRHRHGRERFVDFDEVDVVDRQAGFFQRLARRGNRRGQHHDRVVANHGELVDARTRLQVVTLQRGFRNDQRGAGGVADLARHGGRQAAAGCQRIEGRHFFERGFAHGFVHLEIADRHDFAVETAGVDGGAGAVVRDEGEFFHRLAAEAVFLGDQLRRAKLRGAGGAEARHEAFRFRHGVGEAEFLAAARRGAHRNRAHVLHAAGDDDIHHARHHGLRREMHCLLRRTALAIEADRRHVHRQPGRQPRRARHVAGLRADRVDHAEDHVFVVLGRNCVALHQCRQHVRAEISRMDVGERPLALAGRGSEDVDDIGFIGHVVSPTESLSGQRRMRCLRRGPRGPNPSKRIRTPDKE